MPPGPPDDHDPAWDDLIAQVREAMRGAGLRPGDEDAVEEGLRSALEQLGELSGLVGVVDDPEADHDGPDVELVEGGRSADEPPTRRSGPDLHIAGERDPHADPSGNPPRAGVSTSVRVVRVPSRRKKRAAPLGREGAIRLDVGGQQTVFHGARPRPYRIACTRGALTVSVDGLPAESIEDGQSIDVEAALIRVSTEASEGAEGRYVRLR